MFLVNYSASWGSMGEDIGEAPKLKSARFFTLEELKLCTNDFREINAIGAGGYGRVKKRFFCKLQMQNVFLFLVHIYNFSIAM
jgi:hypothetical protein